MLSQKISNNSLNSLDSLSYSVDSRSYSIDSRSYSIDSTFSYEIRPQSGEPRSRTISIGLTISPGNSYEEKSFIKKQVENEKRKTQILLEESSQKLEQDLKHYNNQIYIKDTDITLDYAGTFNRDEIETHLITCYWAIRGRGIEVNT